MTRKLRLRDRLKLLLGKMVWRDEANVKREQFNDLLRECYDEGLIVDVARAESENPDGSQERFRADGCQHRCLSPVYTSDGGHLNEAGQRAVAAEMAHVLAQAMRRSA
jgi:lysophospholipase L1-like esterase